MLPLIRLLREDIHKDTNTPQEDTRTHYHRNKIGGEPDWLQNEFKPFCQACGQQMEFYAQIDSISLDHILGDTGMIYVFVCLDCLEVYSFIQSY